MYRYQKEYVYLQFVMNRIIKRFFVFAAIVTAAVSCLDGSGYNVSYTAEVTFDYNDEVFNEDSLFFDTKYKVGLGWDYLAFYHKVDETTSEFRGGFLVSGLQTPESGAVSGLSHNQYRSNVKMPASWKNKYAVFCQTSDMPENHLEFAFKDNGGLVGTCAMKSVYVTNTVAVESAMREQFVDGDQLILKATGYLAGEKTDHAEFKLAEFTTAKDSVVSAWTLFDLSKLGTVDKVVFDVQVPPGKEMPVTVCMDNMMASITVKSEE